MTVWWDRIIDFIVLYFVGVIMCVVNGSCSMADEDMVGDKIAAESMADAHHNNDNQVIDISL